MITKRIVSAEIKIGDTVVMGAAERHVIQSRLRGNEVELTTTVGTLTVPRDSRLLVRRGGRTQNQDEAPTRLVRSTESPEAALRATDPRDLTATPEPRKVPGVNFSQPGHRPESQGGRSIPAVRFRSAGA
jgi:hypothetical protein